MNGLPYYKAYPRDFIEGTAGWSFELKAAYRLVLDIIYLQGGRLPDDPRYISGLLGCSVRKWKTLRSELIERGKLFVNDEFLGNERADKELETLRKYQDQQSENATRPNENKRLQKPRQSHTEPEPDTEDTTSVVSKRVNADAEKSASVNEPRVKLLDAMGVGEDGISGPSSFIGTTLDMAEASQWAAMGIPLSQQCEIIKEVCRRKRTSEPGWRPSRFRYFTSAMVDVVRAKTAPLESQTASQIDKWKRMAAG